MTSIYMSCHYMPYIYITCHYLPLLAITRLSIPCITLTSLIITCLTETYIALRGPFFDSLVTLPKHFSVNQPTGLENIFFTFINVFKLFIFFIFERLPQQQERDAVAVCATVCVQYGYTHCTVWRWTTTDKNTQLRNII
jgi:hypothetical protein